MLLRPSSLPILSLCPGALAACADLPEPPQSEHAAHGTALHTHMAAGTTPADHADALLVEKARAALSDLMCIRFSDYTGYTEQQLTATIAGVELSGTPDQVYISANLDYIIIVDYKFGYEPVSPVLNAQLMAYATLAAKRYIHPLRSTIEPAVELVIVQPTVTSRPLIWETTLGECTARTERTIRAAQDEAAPRFPSAAACTYCPALGSCPACSTRALSTTDTTLHLAMADMLPEHRAELLERVKLAEKLCSTLKAQAKDLLTEDPTAVPGWKLAPGATRRTIADKQAAANIAFSAGLTPADMLDCCTLSAAELEKRLAASYQAANGGSKKDATAAARAALLPVLISTTAAPTLKQEK